MERPNRPIEDVLADHTDRWMALQGVEGTALGACDGAPCIVIYASSTRIAETIAATVEGHPVDVRMTGGFRALDSLPDPP